MASAWLKAVPSKRRRGGITWHLRWRENGRIPSRSLRTSDRVKAEGALTEKLRALRSASGQVGKATPAEALDAFLDSRRASGASPHTVAYYDQKLRPLFDRYAHVPLRKWRRPMLEAHLADGPERSPATRAKVVSACRTFVTWAQDAGCVPEGFSFVGRLRYRVKQAGADYATLSREQVAALLDAIRANTRRSAPRYLELAVGLAAYAGLAWGDIAGLAWDAVDLDAGRITGRRQKTGRRYVVGISEPLQGILRRYRAIGGPVVRGLPKDRRAAYRALRRAQDKAGIPPAPKGQNGYHRLRHTYLTWLADAGVPDHQRRLAGGHAPGSAMASRYSHPDDGGTAEATRAAIE